jgi:hypothetical protein
MCGDDPVPDAAPGPDAPEIPDAAPPPDADPTAPDAAPPPDGGVVVPGLDDPCCDPTGQCPTELVCVVDHRGTPGDTTDDVHACRPHCDPAGTGADCPQPSRCQMFSDGTGICLRANIEGEPCSPEFCAMGTICVGPSSDAAFCRRCCTQPTDCSGTDICVMLMGNASCPMACVPPT